MAIESWLPDGIFSYQESKFGDTLKAIEISNVGKFSGLLEYLQYILWPIGRYILWLYGIHFPCFTKKNLAALL
jgi:hypothetical protein